MTGLTRAWFWVLTVLGVFDMWAAYDAQIDGSPWWVTLYAAIAALAFGAAWFLYEVLAVLDATPLRKVGYEGS